VLDNLNGTGIDQKWHEDKKKAEDGPTLQKFVDDFTKKDETDRPMGLLDQFRSALYCQTASAEHWGMPDVVNEIADHLRQKARMKNIATLSADQFWTSIKAFRGKDQMDTAVEVKNDSDNASG